METLWVIFFLASYAIWKHHRTGGQCYPLKLPNPITMFFAGADNNFVSRFNMSNLVVNAGPQNYSSFLTT